MPYQATHPLYQVYLLLADANTELEMGLTEPMARERLKRLLPNWADRLDTIIDNAGDPEKLPEDVERAEAIYQREATESEADEFNALIRGKPRRLVNPAEGETMTAAMRRVLS